MQKFSKFLMLAVVVIGSMLYFQSCDNSCDTVTCLNGGTCTDGACDCPAGTGGDDCGTYLDCTVLEPLCPANSSCAVDGSEASCFCNAGYEGDTCTIVTRTFYTNGNSFYTPLDKCTQGGPVTPGQTFTYDAIKVSNGATVDEIIFESFGGFDSPAVNVKGKITGLNTFSVASQTQAGWGLSVEGQANTNGALDRTANKITLPYKITYADASVDVCTVELTKQ